MSESRVLKLLESFKRGDVGWLELDISFTPYHDPTELEKIKKYYVEHREGEDHEGWESCCIHGLGSDMTGICYDYGYDDEINAPYQWTEVSKDAPKATKFWKEFPAEKFARVRFMKLKPQGHIGMHNDTPKEYPPNLLDFLLPINVAITNPQGCTMEIEGHGIVPWKPGKVFLINILQNHRVTNNSNEERLHMIAQVHPGNMKREFIDLIERSMDKHGL